jgi:alpha-galactosidase
MVPAMARPATRGLLLLGLLGCAHAPAPVEIRTPPPGPQPRINGPSVVGCRPGHPFLYRIPCQGERPIHFAADSLPPTLALDPASGIVTGTDPPRGEYRVTLRAENTRGASRRLLRIVSGDTLALTPPMGWNPWYVHYTRITDAIVRQAADAIVASGMADVGYQYVSLDDCWMRAADDGRTADPSRIGPVRDERGDILPNRHFPDMSALTAYLHAKGLKAGIYSSPGPKTCDGYEGSYGHEAQDARRYADWGFDLLKYDWCSYGHIAKGGRPDDPNLAFWGETTDSLPALQRPYRRMGALLREQSRDIVFNLCQYGMGRVWEWGTDAGGQSWRTAGDVGFELHHLFEVALANSEHAAWSRPGAWNDPDYLQIGRIGDVHTQGQPAPCPLTPDEQYAFVSLWCLMAAPLFYSGDVTALDPFTRGALCNPEVIEVDQDELGRAAAPLRTGKKTFLLIKDLADGGKAVGLFNQGTRATEVSVSWTALGIADARTVRDLWRRKDLGRFDAKFHARVAGHGAELVKIGPG